jgi:hypothetical protein
VVHFPIGRAGEGGLVFNLLLVNHQPLRSLEAAMGTLTGKMRRTRGPATASFRCWRAVRARTGEGAQACHGQRAASGQQRDRTGYEQIGRPVAHSASSQLQPPDRRAALVILEEWWRHPGGMVVGATVALMAALMAAPCGPGALLA